MGIGNREMKMKLLGTLCLLCCLSFCSASGHELRGTLNQQPQPQLVKGKPVQVVVSIKVLSDTKPLQIPAAGTLHFFRKADDNPDSRVIIAQLQPGAKQPGQIITAPSMRTLAGLKALMRTQLAAGGLESAYAIEVTPTIDDKGRVKLAYDSALFTGEKADVVLGRFAGAFPLEAGESILLSFQARDKKRYYLVEITPEIVRD